MGVIQASYSMRKYPPAEHTEYRMWKKTESLFQIHYLGNWGGPLYGRGV
jgi:hypothetical protein